MPGLAPSTSRLARRVKSVPLLVGKDAKLHMIVEMFNENRYLADCGLVWANPHGLSTSPNPPESLRIWANGSEGTKGGVAQGWGR